MDQRPKYLLLCAIMILSCCTLNAQNIIYVNLTAKGNHDGSTWKNAYKSLQKALDMATNNDTIWVAAGVYKPQQPVRHSTYINRRNNSFHVSGKNIAVYGGFKGDEKRITERNIHQHPTIFSGDFKGDDKMSDSSFLTFSNNNENAYHVFLLVAVPKATFNGVTVKGGNANEASSLLYDGEEVHNDFGGGIYSYSTTTPTSIDLVHSHIIENSAVNEGGGIYVASLYSSSKVNVLESNIKKNISGKYGGGISCYSSSSSSASVTVKKSRISDNRAAYYGGGIYSSCSTYSTSSYSTITVTNSIINGNYAGDAGGGIFSYSSSSFVKIASSLVWTHALDGSNIYQDPEVNIDSNGYNVFSDSPNGHLATDKVNVSSSQRKQYVEAKEQKE